MSNNLVRANILQFINEGHVVDGSDEVIIETEVIKNQQGTHSSTSDINSHKPGPTQRR